MIDRWYYTHDGQTLGPVTALQLRQLADSGRLAPNDLVWPEGRDRKQGVPAQAAVHFAAPTQPAPPLANKPEWLDDIRTLANTAQKSAAPAKPDWLDDVRAAEEVEQEFLTLEWDGDKAASEEEMVNQLLDQMEGKPAEESMTEFIPEPPEPAKSVGPAQQLVIGSAATRGRVRDRNEDSLLVQQSTWSNLEQRHDIALIVIADGMGGHQAGDRASGLVVRALGGVLAPLLTTALGGTASPPARAALAEALERGLQEANRLVLQAAKDNADCKDMGSTAVALLIWDGHAIIRLVGDCRVYHWRAGKLTQVTRDQTLVARMVELGQLSPAEAAAHPRRNEVTQAIGKFSRVEPARYERPLQRGDWLIACCDGLYAHVEDRTLAEEIAKAGSSAAQLANRLIELANQGGGSDNCTVAALCCV